MRILTVATNPSTTVYIGTGMRNQSHTPRKNSSMRWMFVVQSFSDDVEEEEEGREEGSAWYERDTS